jgi:hypothetical protein
MEKESIVIEEIYIQTAPWSIRNEFNPIRSICLKPSSYKLCSIKSMLFGSPNCTQIDLIFHSLSDYFEQKATVYFQKTNLSNKYPSLNFLQSKDTLIAP